MTVTWQIVMTVAVWHTAHTAPSPNPAPRPITPRPHRALDPTSSTGGHRFSRAHFEFTLDLYGALVRESTDEQANVLFSPVCVAALLYPLLLSEDQVLSQQVRQGHTTMMDNFEDAYYQGRLHLARSLFVQAGSPSAAFVREQYKGPAQEVDILGNATGVLKGIDQWVQSQTDGRVVGAVTEAVTEAVTGSVAEQQGAVEGLAVVAVYYSGQWLHQFQPNLTFDKGLFYPSSESRFEVPMMVGKLELPLGYSPEMEVRILELPYASRRVSMFVLLPDDPDFGLARLEANFTSDTVKALFSTLKDERVNLRLPRFRVGVSPPVQAALKSLGLLQIFPPAAFAEESSGPRLVLHDTLHKYCMTLTPLDDAVLEVREEGEETPSPQGSGGEQVGTFGDKYFEVDHPFLLLVWDYIASSVVFMGRVVNPEPIVVAGAS
ncbi:leukocyte elastase inhibitor-like [Penaeus indicus]|uniref:leukocyte elastase inhibitor-like n=1 Tax=Penaeus indicus TaxID=29960 RepID=UPI00300CDC54